MIESLKNMSKQYIETILKYIKIIISIFFIYLLFKNNLFFNENELNFISDLNNENTIENFNKLEENYKESLTLKNNLQNLLIYIFLLWFLKLFFNF